MNSCQYTCMISEIEGIVSVFADVEGGLWFLAIFSEMLQGMLNIEAHDSAQLSINELYRAAGMEAEMRYMDRDKIKCFPILLTESIINKNYCDS